MRRQLAALAGFALAAVPGAVSAETVGGSVTSFGPGEWLSLVLRLGLVIGVIWGAVYAMRWYTRRAGGERAGVARTLDIVETRSLGPNRALHLVRIGERAVLIGVTPERINALMQIDDPEVLDSLELTSGGTSRPAAAFSALLAGFGAGTSKSSRASIEATEASLQASLDAAESEGLVEDNDVDAALTPEATDESPELPALTKDHPAHSAAPLTGVPVRRRTVLDRVVGVFGFTPVETAPQAVARLRAQRAAAQAAMRVPMPVPMPIPISVPMHAVEPAPVRPAVTPASLAPAAALSGPRTSLFDRIEAGRNDRGSIAATLAPSATQALRALSGYAAAQQSSHAGLAESMRAMEAMDHDERIAEARRAIETVRKAG